MPDELTNHEHFGELSALAFVGQISPSDYRELQRHLNSCAACREEHRDFAAILSTDLPLLHQQPILVESRRTGREDFVGASADIPETFQGDPRRRGDFSSGALKTKFAGDRRSWALLPPPHLTAAVCAALLLAVIFLSIVIHRRALREGRISAELTALNAELRRLRGQEPANPRAASSVPTTQGPVRADSDKEHHEAAVRALQAQLGASRAELQQLKDELANSRAQETEISARAHDAQERFEKATQEIEAVTQERNQTLASVQNKQQEVEALTLELSRVQDSVERDRRLLAANRDIRDLMGARNLRIIDVFDVDSKGRTRKPFGRVFFTEGKSLVFYAFDLDRESAPLQAAAFQGWGSQSPDRSGVRSLGIFYRDDQTANRWFLKFDNQQVLAEIDSVFVTIEPPGGSRKPTGARLLSAYLKADLNHP